MTSSVAMEYVENLIHEVIEKLVNDHKKENNEDHQNLSEINEKESKKTRPPLADKTNRLSSAMVALEEKLVEYQKTEYAMSAVRNNVEVHSHY